MIRNRDPLWHTAPMQSILSTLSLFLLISSTSLFLSGCSETVNLDGTGEVCVSAEEGWPTDSQTFEEGAPVYVTVRFAECLSDSCTSARSASCTVLLEGNQLIVDAEGSYIDESSAGTSCTTACNTLDAECRTPGPLPAGEYTVVYGDASMPLTVPSLTGLYCFSAD